MKLSNAVQRDYKDSIKRMNAMFAFIKKDMSRALKDYQSNVIKIASYHLLNMPKISFMTYVSTPVEHNMRREISMQRDIAFKRILPLWNSLRNQTNLHGRLCMAFFSRKTQPPWYPVKVDLASDSKSKYKINNSNVLLYYLKMVDSLVMGQIEIGAKNEESPQQILKRVRGLFSDISTHHREASKDDSDQANDGSDPEQFDTSFTVDVWDKPPAEVSEGVYTSEDIQYLQDHQKVAMDWYYTDYNPDMDEAVWARNKAFMGLEQDLMSDVVDQLHQGMLQIGSDNMGISDMVWVTSKPQPKCDECCDRDGLTMTEIKERIKDKFGDQPPRLHPHCRCQIVPQINDDWTDQQLNRSGYEWDTDNGLAFIPDQQEKKLGFTSMTYDQWLGNLSSLRGVPARSVAF